MSLFISPFLSSLFKLHVLVGAVTALLVSLLPLEIYADGGTLLDTTTLLHSGNTRDKIDIVLLGDGFTDAQQDVFNTRVEEAIREFLNSHPIFALRSAFNFHRVNIGSPESGTDHFSTCNGMPTEFSDRQVRTALDTGYCNAGRGTGAGSGSVYRAVASATESTVFEFARAAPDDDIIVVVINDSDKGGSAIPGDTPVAFMTLHSEFKRILVHELGHAVFNLADEYDYEGPGRYAGSEPPEANITVQTNRDLLKWNSLVLPSTAIPTQRKNEDDCRVRTRPPEGLPPVPEEVVASDIVGTFEGATYSSCDIYRGEPNCTMRHSAQPFGAVCRRKIIQSLVPHLGSVREITFDRLLIKDDHDPWPRGNGEIYLLYDLRANAEEISGRWPASGESSFGNNQTKVINVYAGTLPEPAAGTSAAIGVRVREADWPDADDALSTDATEVLPALGSFTVDRSDYRLQGNVRPADLRVLLDSLHIKNDRDAVGTGDVFIQYTVSNGQREIRGRWPFVGTVGINDGRTREVGILAAAISRPATGNNLTIRIRVVDEDFFGDAVIGEDTFIFTRAQDYGAAAAVHVFDRSNYRITLSVAGTP